MFDLTNIIGATCPLTNIERLIDFGVGVTQFLGKTSAVACLSLDGGRLDVSSREGAFVNSLGFSFGFYQVNAEFYLASSSIKTAVVEREDFEMSPTTQGTIGLSGNFHMFNLIRSQNRTTGAVQYLSHSNENRCYQFIVSLF